MDAFLRRHNLVTPFESGFRSNQSTTSALLKSDNIGRSLDKKLACVLVLLDFSKAFDTVDHGLIWKKLQNHNSTSTPQLLWRAMKVRLYHLFFSGVHKALSWVTHTFTIY